MQQNVGTVVKWPVIGTDVQIGADVPCECMRHAFKQGTDFGFAVADTPLSTKERFLFVPSGIATIEGFHAVVVTPGGSSASVSVDLLKNGSSILSAAIALTNSSVSRQIYDAVIANGALSGGEDLTAKLTVTTPGAMAGLFAWVTWQEKLSPI